MRRHMVHSPEARFLLPQRSLDNIDKELHHVDPSYQPKCLRASTSIDLTDLDDANVGRILVLYTGGTIGMGLRNGVHVPEPGILVSELRKLPMFHDKEYAMYNFSGDAKLQPLAMPITREGKRIVYHVWEYDPLMNSCNMTMTDYAHLASDIESNYDKFDGFVVLHGRDTMAYTASALSFMCENLGKTVIITGSQIPIIETRSDGRDNLLSALIIAGNYVIPEVSLYFNNKLFRGNRSTKVDATGFDSFDSPNMAPLIDMEISIHVHWDSVLKPQGSQQLHVHKDLCPNVGLLRLFPSITEATVRAFLQPPIEGVVVQSYGTGNAPTKRTDLMAAFKEAAERGVILVNTTQCQRGAVVPTYCTGQALVDLGFVPVSDMTPEAALTKLAYVLGKQDWSIQKMKETMGENLRGEMTVASKESFSLLDFQLIEHLAESMRLSSGEEIQRLGNAVMPSLMCAAAKSGDVGTINKLKDAGGLLGLADYDGRTPLHVAASEGQAEVVQYLVENGAMVHVKDFNGDSPLVCAVRKNHVAVIEQLVKAGSHLMKGKHHLGTELCMAALHGDTRNLLSWIKAGCDVNQGDNDKRTALHVAASHGLAQVVEFLLQHGANPHLIDSFGLTPMDRAQASGHTGVMSVLDYHNQQADKMDNTHEQDHQDDRLVVIETVDA